MVRLSLIGITIGVASMGIVLSVMEGFEEQLKGRLFRTDIHILVEPTAKTAGFRKGTVPESRPLDLPDTWELQEVSAVLQQELLLRGPRRVSGVMVKGLSEGALTAIKRQVTESRLDVPGMSEPEGDLPPLWIGTELASELNLVPGDHVVLVSPLEFSGPLQNIPRAKTFQVEGLVQTGSPDSEQHFVWVPEKMLQNFLRLPDRISQWEISLKRLEDAGPMKQAIVGRWPDLKVRDWRDLNQKLFASLHLERIGMFVILGLIVLVGSFNIVATLTLLVLEKRREIAILRTIGAGQREIVRIFLFEALLLAIGGIGIGLVITLGAIQILKSGDWIQLPEAYYDRSLPVALVPGYYVGIAAFTLVLSLLAGRGPARRASSWTIIEGIQRKA